MKNSRNNTRAGYQANYNEPSSMKAVFIFFAVVTAVAITVISLTGGEL